MSAISFHGLADHRYSLKPRPYAAAQSSAFTIAISRGKDRNGKDAGSDFPNIVCFGKTAELVEKYVSKGRLVAIQGKIQSGSYEKDDRKVYTTEVVADKVEFLDKASGNGNAGNDSGNKSGGSDILEGFENIDDIPF